MNPETGEQVFSASIAKDLPFSAINSGCGIYRCRNKEVFVGSADGMISFGRITLSGTIRTMTCIFQIWQLIIKQSPLRTRAAS